ncbi:MAG TPA: HAMP domain-containing sensor histidine kinase [Spirochaetia bacterium]|nr:HAMP domain-containing sensor histidine kinase [Spirochaetales bacterium]HRY78950.1 HAMP domain-containing sensor histidine kinase [Spirochaetia bacterium]
MNTTLRGRLTLSHALLAAAAVLAAGGAARLVARERFDAYIAAGIESRVHALAASVSAARDPGGGWDHGRMESLGVGALEDGFILRLLDGTGSVLWDAREHNAGLCSQMIESMAVRMAGADRGGGYRERSVALPSLPGDAAPPALVAGYYGPVYYRDAELAFLRSLDRVLAAVGLGLAALAVLAGAWSARRLSAPLRSAARAARSIGRGDFDIRLPPSGIRELDELSGALSRLSGALGEQEELRKRLVADASHELRTPLASLRARLEALLDGVRTPDEAALEACRRDALRLGSLVGSLEGLARADAAAYSGAPETFDLAAAVRSVCAAYRDSARAGNLDIRTDAPEPVPVSGDRPALEGAVGNLLSNALRFSDPGGTVEVRVRLARGDGDLPEPAPAPGTRAWAVVEVEDEGIGISPEDLPRVFERFFRADPSRSRDTGGFGLGLAIVRAAARAHGGEAYAESPGPGRGSRFLLVLPAAPEGLPDVAALGGEEQGRVE